MTQPTDPTTDPTVIADATTPTLDLSPVYTASLTVEYDAASGMLNSVDHTLSQRSVARTADEAASDLATIRVLAQLGIL